MKITRYGIYFDAERTGRGFAIRWWPPFMFSRIYTLEGLKRMLDV